MPKFPNSIRSAANPLKPSPEPGWRPNASSAFLTKIAKVAVPAIIFGLGWLTFQSHYDVWGGCKYLCLLAALAIYCAVILRGRLRDISVLAASLLLGLAAAEAYAVLTLARPLEVQAQGYSVSRPILGWGPQHPGVFHNIKFTAKTRRVIFDAHYTIDANLNRKVVSAPSGPAVAFFGDSFTFGTGLDDRETLPQIFSDLHDRKIGVFNFGFPGYGPQQFLRALETNMFDPLLRGRVRLFVFEATSYLAVRASCKAGWMLRAPRYEMVDGHAVYRGACYQQWTILNQLFANTSLYHEFVEPTFGGPTRSDIDLFIGILVRATRLAREKYGAPTLIVYSRNSNEYLRHSGLTEEGVIQRMRQAGLDVIDTTLDPKDFPGMVLKIPGDGHPTGVTNAARARLIDADIQRRHLLDLH